MRSLTLLLIAGLAVPYQATADGVPVRQLVQMQIDGDIEAPQPAVPSQIPPAPDSQLGTSPGIGIPGINLQIIPPMPQRYLVTCQTDAGYCRFAHPEPVAADTPCRCRNGGVGTISTVGLGQ